MIKKVITTIKYKWDNKMSKKRKTQESKDSYNSISYKVSTRRVNVVLGSLCVVYGVATIFAPTGSIWAIMLGLFLISCPLSIGVLCKRLYEDIKFYVGVCL